MRITAILILLMGLLIGNVLDGEVISADDQSVVYRQPDGTQVQLPKYPKRVVIAYGSLAKVWDLAGGTAVGVPDLPEKRALPAAMRDLPAVGSATVPNVEKIMMLEPDLVLLIGKLEKHRAAAELLRQSKVAAVCVNYDNYDDFIDLLGFFCQLNDKTVNDVPVAAQVTKEVQQICDKATLLKPVRCAIIFAAATGFSLESARTNTGLIAAKLGADNVVKSASTGRVPLGFEQLLIADPEVILVVLMGDHEALQDKFRREFMEQPAWGTLSAARNQRVHFLPVELFLYVPGPRFAEAFRDMAILLYPGEHWQ